MWKKINKKGVVSSDLLLKLYLEIGSLRRVSTTTEKDKVLGVSYILFW